MRPIPIRRGLALGVALALPQFLRAETLEEVQKLASEWARLRTESSRIETDWSLEKGLLKSSITALESRIAALEENRAALAAANSKDLAEHAEAVARNAELSAGLKADEASLVEVSQRLVALRASLPPRLSSALELPYRSLSKPGLPVGERMQYVMTIIGRTLSFNRMVTYAEEAVALDGGGEERMLRVLYWGLAQAYALDTSTRRAFLGRPVNGAWRWEPIPEAVPQVERLLAIHGEKADPEFVRVPARLGHTDAKR